MCVMNKYTTIRYHIFKEFSKHRKLQEKRSSDRIIEFAIPILSGLIVQLCVIKFRNEIDYAKCWEFSLYILIIIACFMILVLFLKKLYSGLNQFIKNKHPYRSLNHKKNEAEIEEDAARFNYEVTYLVEAAYHIVKNLENNDNVETKLKMQNAIFCVKKADEKIKQSLMSSSDIMTNAEVSHTMVSTVFEMIDTIITKLKEFSNKTNLFIDEVDDLRNRYTITYDEVTARGL